MNTTDQVLELIDMTDDQIDAAIVALLEKGTPTIVAPETEPIFTGIVLFY